MPDRKRQYDVILKNLVFKVIGYEPHEKQKPIHDSSARFITAICGRRFGKSLLAAREVEALLCNPLKRNQRIWVVAPTYTLADKVFKEVWTDVIVGREIDGKKAKPLIDPRLIAKSSENDRIIKTVWGSEIIGKSADNPNSLVGDALDLLIFDECAKCKQSVWEKYLRPSMTDRAGRVFFITTPEGKNWVHDLYKDGINDRDVWDSYSYTTLENPYLNKADIEDARQKLTKETYEQEYLARFVSFKGKVYKLFDPNVHVTRDIPDRFDEIIIGLDYGFVNPSAIIVIGIKDGRFYVIDEVYRSGMQIEDIVIELKRLKIKYKFSTIYPDVNPAYNKTLTSAGFLVKLAKKDVAVGIECVAGKMKLQKDNKPLFFVHPRCENVIDEHDNYRYPETKDNQNDKEEPVKFDDHTCDAVRYAIYTHTKRFVPRMISGDVKVRGR